ncbi:MAG: sigma-70 family RNA polymerase sigma factor [Verrucomicrobiae bacterium]|nr:sigma-70 family RNA polymerase sigma factor [Verrucomicrobiae bacterium]
MKANVIPIQPKHQLDPANWGTDYREYLIRFALQRISDYGLAEDLVQDTFLSAWNARESFRGDCAERTWLTGVLRNKIIDHYRRNARRPMILAGDFEAQQQDEGPATPWLENRANETDTYDPSKATERAEMMTLLDAAVDQLPEAMAQAYRMREIQGRSTEEITRTLKISKGNLWVLIHRAKQALKEELQGVWGGPDYGTGMAA